MSKFENVKKSLKEKLTKGAKTLGVVLELTKKQSTMQKRIYRDYIV